MLRTRKKISEDQTRRIEKLKKEAKKQIKAKGRKDLKAILDDIFHRSRGLQHCADSKQFSQKLKRKFIIKCLGDNSMNKIKR